VLFDHARAALAAGDDLILVEESCGGLGEGLAGFELAAPRPR
jgi:hypothetical protein